MRNTPTILLGLVLLCSCNSSHKTNLSTINLSATLVRTYDTILSWDTTKFKAYDIDLKLLNNSDTSVTFWIMSCAWQWNFIINNDYIRIISEGCSSNFPTHIKLNANESLYRKASVIKINNTFGQFIKETRFGFIYIDSTECKTDDDYLIIIADLSKQNNIIWSNELYLNDEN